MQLTDAARDSSPIPSAALGGDGGLPAGDGGGAGRGGRQISHRGGGHAPLRELPEWIDAFTKRYPAVEISIRTGRSQAIIVAIAERQLDLAFVRVPVVEPGISRVDLYEEAIILVSHPAHSAGGMGLSPAELQSLPLILFPRGTSFRAQLDTAFATLGITPRVRMETDSVEEVSVP